MNKILITCLLFLSLGTRAQMSYFNYLDSTVEWRNYAYGFNSGVGGSDTYYSTVYFDGDTLINSNYYYKQYTLTTDSSVSPLGTAAVNTQLSGPMFIREDSSLKFWQYYSGADHLNMDWKAITSLQVGDTFPIAGANCPVQVIDSLLVIGRYLKQYHGTVPFQPNSILEGVGQLRQLCNSAIESDNYTACFKKQNSTLQFSILDCNVFPIPQRQHTLSIKKLPENIHLTIYPNPNNGNFVVETNIAETQVLQMFDVASKTLLSQNISYKTIIDASNLDNGIYFMQVKTNDNISTQKIIVQH